MKKYLQSALTIAFFLLMFIHMPSMTITVSESASYSLTNDALSVSPLRAHAIHVNGDPSTRGDSFTGRPGQPTALGNALTGNNTNGPSNNSNDNDSGPSCGFGCQVGNALTAVASAIDSVLGTNLSGSNNDDDDRGGGGTLELNSESQVNYIVDLANGYDPDLVRLPLDQALAHRDTLSGAELVAYEIARANYTNRDVVVDGDGIYVEPCDNGFGTDARLRVVTPEDIPPSGSPSGNGSDDSPARCSVMTANGSVGTLNLTSGYYPSGATVELAWNTTGRPTPTASIDNGIGSVDRNGTRTVTVTDTTTFTLTANNSQGSGDCQVTIVMNQPSGPAPTYVCNDPGALNYVTGAQPPLVLPNNALCSYPQPSPIPPVLGCTNPLASNFNNAATADDGSCTLPTVPVYACTDNSPVSSDGTPVADNAVNLPGVTSDNSLCEYTGCRDTSAVNYESYYTVSDSSACVFPGTPAVTLQALVDFMDPTLADPTNHPNHLGNSPSASDRVVVSDTPIWLFWSGVQSGGVPLQSARGITPDDFTAHATDPARSNQAIGSFLNGDGRAAAYPGLPDGVSQTYRVEFEAGNGALYTDQITLTGGTPTVNIGSTQCNDTVDNDTDSIATYTSIDASDPGCHTDEDPTNPVSYDPTDDTEAHTPNYPTLTIGDVTVAAQPGILNSDEVFVRRNEPFDLTWDPVGYSNRGSCSMSPSLGSYDYQNTGTAVGVQVQGETRYTYSCLDGSVSILVNVIPTTQEI